MNLVQVTLKDGSITQVDEQDAGVLALGAWRYSSCGRKKYVMWSTTRDGVRVQFRLHRLILGARSGQIVDHIDGNTLNNARSNLRFVTAAENARNSVKGKRSGSRFKGVTRHPDGWNARIWNGEKNVYLGKTQNEVQAAYWYDLASIEMHGEFGRRNFLPLVTG